MRVCCGPIPLSQMVSVPFTEIDQYPMSQMNGSDSHTGTDLHGRYKTHEVSLDVDVESDLEKKG